MFAPVYFDCNATTPVDSAVVEAMLPWLAQRYGNPSSRHEYGRAARAAIDRAREQVATTVGAHPTEVVFTGGGSEANNLFIRGLGHQRGQIGISAVEHPSVREPARLAGRVGGWGEIAVDGEGRIDREDFSAMLQQRPTALSIMLANNETGVIQDIAVLAEQAKPTQAWFHSDAVQALGKIPIDFRALNATGVHALSLSAHKVGGPKGVGALVVDKRLELEPVIAGGGQERGLRSGTENVPAIVGFGLACELAAVDLAPTALRLASLRDELERGLIGLGAIVFGQGAKRLPNTCFFALPNIDGETLVGKLDRAGFAVASGSACSSVHPGPSHVLLAMGVDAQLARGAVRVSLGRQTSSAEVGDFLNVLGQTIFQFKRLAALAG
jgi:cysteine desulfurase